MTDVVISVENLSKRYLIGVNQGAQERYIALRDVMAAQAGNLVRNITGTWGTRKKKRPEKSEFWALQDVNFEVKRGTVLGIVGPNGAGKSTLLKILSRITEPSAGRIALRGRVSSLLEVGTGFHPELTGRENIYLNGAILGLARNEIRRRFDEIVEFAEIKKFLETPVKRYSSGMYVRLAFAVAAHLDSDILIVDEVLAVGDAEFQKKCLGKMGDVAQGGRTVLFVTHDMRRAAELCEHGILLREGRIAFEGGISATIKAYMENRNISNGVSDLSGRGDRSGSGEVRFQSIRLLKNDTPCDAFSVGESFAQEIRLKADGRIGPVVIGSTIVTSDGVNIYQLLSEDDGFRWQSEPGEFVIRIVTERLLLYPGSYVIDLWMGDRNTMRLDYVQQAIGFTVTQDAGLVGRELDRGSGLLLQSARWSCSAPSPERVSEPGLQ